MCSNKGNDIFVQNYNAQSSASFNGNNKKNLF